MITSPTPPSPGKPVRAGFFASLIQWIKSGQLIEGKNYRLRRGPNGTELIINLPKQVASAPQSAMHYWQCEIKPKLDQDGNETGEFEGGWYNCKAQIGFNVSDLLSYYDKNSSRPGFNKIDPGKYYAKFKLDNAYSPNSAISIITETEKEAEDEEENHYLRNVVYMYIGEIHAADSNHKYPYLKSSIDCIPCIYMYV